MSDLNFFDCHCMVGPMLLIPEWGRYTTERLLDDMDVLQIRQTLLVHSLAVCSHPFKGNGHTMETVAPHRDKLVPAWVLVPDQMELYPKPEQ